ncbi:MAG: cation transporter [Myxococcota bacterium]
MAGEATRASEASKATSFAVLRRAVGWVTALNLGYFFVEIVVARRIDSVSLFADSIDFLEDATINGLILVALGWTVRRRSQVGMFLAGVLLVPGIATLWTAWGKLAEPVAPHPGALGLAGGGALAVNLFCALLLARFRAEAGSLMRAAFLSARNDALANVGIIAAGVVTAGTGSIWPDLAVGLAIFVMNFDAAVEVHRAARRELHLAGFPAERQHRS